MLRSTRAIPVRPGSVSVFLDNNASIFMAPMLHANPQPLVEARRITYHIRHCDHNDTTCDTLDNIVEPSSNRRRAAKRGGRHIMTTYSRV
ncbi:hypothetical protein GCM10023319_83280 [Nocardia iowensis]